MSIAPAPLHRPIGRLLRPAFTSLPPQALAELDAISTPVEYSAGAFLVQQGEPPTFVRVLCYGRVKIYTCSPEGKTLLLKVGSEGAVIGMASAIGGIPHDTTAEAYEPCMAYAIHSKDFLAFLSRHKMASWQALQMVVQENHELLVNARRLALSGTVAGNVAELLLDWGTIVTANQEKKQFKMVLTHQEIAEMVGTSRETVTRTLASFRQQGWIRIHGASVEILQQEKMKGISV